MSKYIEKTRILGENYCEVKWLFDEGAIQYLVGDERILSDMAGVRALPIFSDMVLEFLEKLSRLLLEKDMREQSDVVSLGFWIRKKSLERARRKYEGAGVRLGRGLVFHIAPSNIPVQFAVSLVYALVAGNASVVRVSSKEFLQVDLICSAINKALKDMPQMAPYICIIRYGRNEEVTKKLSSMCDARLVWGGDNTVREIRRFPIGARAIDFGFADRYSFAVIHSEYYLTLDKERVAADFYNDTYFSDQNACSSPRLVVWLGGRVEEARNCFWEALKRKVDKKYNMADISASNKLLTTTLCAAKYEGVKEIKSDNSLVRLELPELYGDIIEYKGNSGYFFEYIAKDLDEIAPMFKKECQTITYIGDLYESIRELVIKTGTRGVDRITRVGRGMEMSFVWDGLDIINALSRIISDE